MGQREISLIFGQTGSGKTTAAKSRLRGLSRVLVLEAGFDEFPVSHFDTADEVLLYLETRGAFPHYGRPSLVPFAVGFTPLESEHDFCFDLAKELGGLSLIMDEGDRFDPRASEAYDEIITRGRHWGVSLVVVGLHAYALPKNLRRQATSIKAFRQVDPSDLDALAEIVGPLAYRLGPDATGRFSLPDFASLEWTPRSGARLIGPDGKDLTSSKATVILPPSPPESEETAPGGVISEDSGGEINSPGDSKCPRLRRLSSDSE